MKVKVADYIADYLVRSGITQAFSVVGGGSIHLNDALGHQQGLQVVYTHHEQAAAIAAEAYARLTSRIAAVCVTSGPGATNAITGCLCGYMGSIPMLILSGQVRYPLTVRALGLDLRTNGEQEYDICRSVSGMTKYCEMITDPKKIRYCLEKALDLAYTGRPGPCWLDIPLDVQGAVIETEDLVGYCASDEDAAKPPKDLEKQARAILKKIQSAERPVLHVGQGVRTSGTYEQFRELIDLLKIPVTTGMASVDLVPDAHPFYAGRPGVTGDRAGNFAVQNCDVFLSLGSRLSYKQTGYKTESWARGAYKIMVDIDREELKRDYLHIDMPVWADVKDLIETMLRVMRQEGIVVGQHKEWIRQCKRWQKQYPVVTEQHYNVPDGRGSIYVFYKILSELMPECAVYVTSAGTARVICSQASVIKEGQRIIVNPSAAPTGYCLPAAVGVCLGNERKPVVLVTGEGGFQMNIQELQTIVHNKLPIKIFVINNEGYHSIRMTQNSFFKGRSHVGLGEESMDLSFPDLSKIAGAYGYPYFECRNNEEMPDVLEKLLAYDGYALCQVFVTKDQVTAPKAASKLLPDGQMVSAPLEDMAPFLPKEELKRNMYIPLIKE